MPKRILVIDDERLARQRIVRFIRDRNEGHTIAEATNGLDALEKIPTFRPDVVFLDIAMPGLSGFEVLYQLEDREFAVIFQTAFDKFAVKAFEENACDYLLKPFTRERLVKALDRAVRSSTDGKGLAGLERGTLADNRFLTRIAVRHRNQLKIVAEQDIIAFVSRDHYTHVCTLGGEYLCELSIAHLAERLAPERFRQVHRHSIVRVDAITSVTLGEAMTVELRNGLKVPVSRSRRTIVSELTGGR